jgi:hypothetical protein
MNGNFDKVTNTETQSKNGVANNLDKNAQAVSIFNYFFSFINYLIILLYKGKIPPRYLLSKYF